MDQGLRWSPAITKPRPAQQLLGHAVIADAVLASAVYSECMVRTNIDIDDQACAEVMRRYSLATKREAVNFALRTLAAEPLSIDEARVLSGVGWDGDLDLMRSGRSP